jgi:hypothetical protein
LANKDPFVAVTKNGLQRIAAPPAADLSKLQSDKKITDEEILKILDTPLGKAPSAKPKNKKKKKTSAAKKAAAAAAAKKPTEEEEDDDEDSDEDDSDEDDE